MTIDSKLNRFSSGPLRSTALIRGWLQQYLGFCRYNTIILLDVALFTTAIAGEGGEKKSVSGLLGGRVGLSSGRVTLVLAFVWILTIPWNSTAHPTALKMSTLISSRAFILFAFLVTRLDNRERRCVILEFSRGIRVVFLVVTCRGFYFHVFIN